MKKLLKHLLPDNHSTRIVMDVLNRTDLIEFTKGLLVTALGLFVLPMLFLMWEVRDVIA
ncbi:hypothetical protein [Sphingopyxis yananensis]|uniref:hypothetical protein n=1 Tax=Sphingopyxis yananensis TaxID=2886687 RepID=UPI001D1191ED|nr:hypothetical protein [Sphingopyxis yananensis]MCC2602558.1 hypothetical protein [Sphingopyxis yananensis]